MELKDLLPAVYGAGLVTAGFIGNEIRKLARRERPEPARAEPPSYMHAPRDSSAEILAERTRMLIHEAPDTSPIRMAEQIKVLQRDMARIEQLWKDERTARHTLEREFNKFVRENGGPSSVRSSRVDPDER